jgi:hypothetical protein
MPANYSFASIFYLAFRLAPFILVSFFALSALINADIKGIIFIAMILCSAIVTKLIGTTIERFVRIPEGYAPDVKCQALYIMGETPISPVLPLNINVIAFVFAYLLYIINITGRVVQNIPTLILFPAFLGYQIYWSSLHRCSPIINSFISMAIGGLMGWGFSAAVEYSKLPELQYFTGVKNQDVCKTPSKTKFRCGTKIDPGHT